MKSVKIEDVSYEGAGVGKLDGKVVFVPKTLLNESVQIEITKENAKFAQAKIVNVIEKSDLRRAAFCPYFEKCGGCDFQHCDYDVEIDLKKQILARELVKIGFFNEIQVEKSEKRFGYRNKIKLEVRDEKVGYFKSKSHDFFEIDFCPIATKEINDVITLLRSHLADCNYKMLRNIYIKQLDENIGICFLFDKNAQKLRQKFKKNDFLNDFSIFFAYGNVLESDKTQVFCMQGDGKLQKRYGDLKTDNDISAFNQVNDDVAKKLYDFVCALTKDKRVINAYSGQGLLTALISQGAKFVYGIEYQTSAHKAAQSLTENIRNVFNVCGKVEEEIGAILKRDRIDFIVLDPAREGCKENVLKEIIAQKIEKIAYISCNFSTLVRDLAILRENYDIKEIKLFDMFPCTANMETVAILALK